MKVRHIIIKDLKLILSDRKALAIIILMPLVLSTILGFALVGSFGSDFNTEKMNIALVKNYDEQNDIKNLKKFINTNELTKQIGISDSNPIENIINQLDIDDIFTEQFLNNNEISNIIQYVEKNEEEAMDLLSNKDITAVIILPEKFLYNMYINFLTPLENKIDIKVMGHPDMSISANIVKSIVSSFADMTSSIIIQKNVLIESIIENNGGYEALSNISSIIGEISTNKSNNSINLEYEKVKGKDPITSNQYYTIAMTTMFILFVAGYGSKLLLDEKFNKTYQRMVVSGISKWKLLSGKFLVIFIMGIVQVSIMVVYSNNILKSSWGNYFHIGIITICAIFAVAGLGIMLAAISYKSENYKIADLAQSVIFQIMALLGGSFIPIDFMPRFVKILSNFTLNGLALKAYTKVVMGYGLKDIVSFLIALIIMGIIFIILSVVILMKEERGSRNVKYNKA